MQTRVVTIAEQGEPSNMQLENAEIGEPGPDEILIRHTAIGLNYMDVYQRSGHYPLSLPSGLGLEAAGTVEAIGDAVTEFSLGDRVAYAGGPPGSYAEHRIMTTQKVVKIPDGISNEQAAAVMMKGMTAEYLLNRTYPVQPGQWVLFHAAAGGVGLIAGQWGRALSARMIGVAGGPEKCKLALDHGYEVAIDRKSEDIVARVKEITGGEGVPVVFDSVGKDSFDQSIQCLAPRGYFVSFGSTTGFVEPVPPSLLQQSGSLYFTRPTLMTYTASRHELVASATQAFSMVAEGKIRVEINQRYALAEIAQAHTDLEAGRTSGSTIITP